MHTRVSDLSLIWLPAVITDKYDVVISAVIPNIKQAIKKCTCINNAQSLIKALDACDNKQPGHLLFIEFPMPFFFDCFSHTCRSYFTNDRMWPNMPGELCLCLTYFHWYVFRCSDLYDPVWPFFEASDPLRSLPKVCTHACAHNLWQYLSQQILDFSYPLLKRGIFVIKNLPSHLNWSRQKTKHN